jgi:hypothetical protein
MTTRAQYAGRLEELLGAVWPAAMGGDPKVVEVARRVLAQQAKLFGFDADIGAVPPIGDTELGEDDDELAAYRKRFAR